MRILQDDDPMPFGRHEGERMEDVPADYLHHLWTEYDFRNKVKTSPVAEYIDRNFNALKMEHDDGIWEEAGK